MNQQRFIVKPVRGMCLGAGGFVVVDTQMGDETLPFTWRDDAERLARQWNTQHQHEQEQAA